MRHMPQAMPLTDRSWGIFRATGVTAIRAPWRYIESKKALSRARPARDILAAKMGDITSRVQGKISNDHTFPGEPLKRDRIAHRLIGNFGFTVVAVASTPLS